MDWQKQMKQAMTYIESHLAEEIDYNTVAMTMGCSEWEFRRLFSFLAQMPLSEYIRRRRLTVSIEAIRNGEKIIVIAQRYGYESHASFSRAFKNLFGITPTMARHDKVQLKPFQPLAFKLVLKENELMENGQKRRKNIMGSSDSEYAIYKEMDVDEIHQTNQVFWDKVGTELVGGTALPDYGAFITEERCNFFEEVKDKKVLEIGCVTGHSLRYLGERGASELWGLDLSRDQIKKANQCLLDYNLTGNLICSPMESECGLPSNYFDYVYSVFGIGWSTDLEKTFYQVASFLKTGGLFIFSWSHPIHKCVAAEGEEFIFKKNYFDESWYSVPIEGNLFSLSDRKMSTYINALAKAGFFIEELVEESEEALINSRNTHFANKAKMLPVTFVIKARKI